MSEDIYGGCRPALERAMESLAARIRAADEARVAAGGERLYEHLRCRVKDEASMREKLIRKGLEPTPANALRGVRDAVGLRVVCLFIDDVYETVKLLRSIPGCTVVEEKDYIRDAKPNGYRSYHMILEVALDGPDIEGNSPGRCYAEVQLRTIAMDTWAALEHELKYKKHIQNPELIAQELHRCANDLAACDVSMQTLRQIIRGL